jgi:hypothetical protein
MIQKTKNQLKMQYPALLHFSLFGLAVITAIVLPLVYPFQIAALIVLDSCRTLLALNGTLLALVVGFSAFYFAVLDTRRMDTIGRIKEEEKNQAYIEEGLLRVLVSSYREKMRAVSTLLIAIALSYGFFLLVTYAVYLYSLSMYNFSVMESITGLASSGFNVSAASPFVTVGDAIIMTWYLTRDVAGKTEKQQLKDREQAQKELDTFLKQEVKEED